MQLVLVAVLAFAMLSNAESQTSALAIRAWGEFALVPDSEGFAAILNQLMTGLTAGAQVAVSLGQDVLVLAGRVAALLAD